MLRGKFFIIVVLFGLFLTCEKNSTEDNNNNDYPAKTYHFSGKVLDCITKKPIAGALIRIERVYCVEESWYGTWYCKSTGSSWTEYYCDNDGYFSASISGKQSDGFNFFAHADNYWGSLDGCVCTPNMTDRGTMLINNIPDDSLLFELVPFDPEIARPVKLYYLFKDGSWPDFGILYTPFYREGYDPGWMYWIYKDTLIISEDYLLCKYILHAEGMNKDSSSSLGYVSGCILHDTITLPFDLKDIMTFDLDTIEFKIEFDCTKDTLILSILESDIQ